MISAHPPVQTISTILCHYSNATPKMQLIRVVDPRNRDLATEKIIFPHQRTLIEAIPEGQLEVYHERDGKQVLTEIRSCRELKAGLAA